MDGRDLARSIKSDESRAGSGLTRREMLGALGGGVLLSLQAACSRDSTTVSSLEGTAGQLHYASLLDVAALVEAGELSPVELTGMMLDRIEIEDTRLHSYTTVMAESALAAAEAAETEIQSGNYRGPLHGMPVAVKDLCYTRGTRTTGGLGPLRDFVPDYDATVVSKLHEAGAILLGKLALTEGAMAGYHRDFEVPVNPWSDELWPGASSSGSGVATAAGLCYAALGTDTGGSIRYPAMSNGVVGLKPTYGRVSRYGVLPLAESLDHVGPLARRVADAAVVLEAISGSDPNDATSLTAPVPDMRAELYGGVSGVRIGFDREYATTDVDSGLVTAIETALGELEGLGAQIVDVDMADLPEELVNAWFAICAYEAHVAHGANYPARADEYGDYFREFLGFGSTVSESAYSEASELRAEFNERYRAALSEVDASVCPAGGVPFPVPAELQYGGMAAFDPVMPNILFQFTIPADFAGTPTVSLPCGITDWGVPYTIQFLGDRLTEPMLCRIAHAYEEATEWHTRYPER